MKDNRKAEIVNEITALAQRYAGTQQLREHMRGAILQYLAEQERGSRAKWQLHRVGCGPSRRACGVRQRMRGGCRYRQRHRN